MLPTRKIIRYNFLKHLWQSLEHPPWALKELQRSHGRSATVAAIRFPLALAGSPAHPQPLSTSTNLSVLGFSFPVTISECSPHTHTLLKFCLATKKHGPMHCSDDTNAVSNYTAVSKFPSQLSRFSRFLNHPSCFTVSVRRPGPRVLEENQRSA